MVKGTILSKSLCLQTQDERTCMSMIPYASARIDHVRYVMCSTRRIICSECHEQIPIRPGIGHWVGIKNILKYLRRTKNAFLIYGDGDLIVNGYSDANFQSDRDDSKS